MAAIYQWPKDGYVDFEYVLLATDQEWSVRYLGMDYRTGKYTNFGSLFAEGNVSVVSDTKNVFTDGNGITNGPMQYIWRGNTFSFVAQGSNGGEGNTTKQLIGFTGLNEHLLFTGVLAFSRGAVSQRYHRDPPYAFGPGYDIFFGDSTLTRWAGFLDFNFGNNGDAAYGDAVVAVPRYDNEYMASFTPYATGNLNLVDRGLSVIGESIQAWGWDHQSGIFACHDKLNNPVSSRISFFQLDMSTLIISYLGVGNANGTVYAVGFTPNGFVVTVEWTGTAYYIRSYSRIDTALTLEDSYLLPRTASSDNIIQTSRITGRMWMLNKGINTGIYVFHTDDAGLIVMDFVMDQYSIGSGGYVGNPIAFLEYPLLITPNGFEGIKEKLFECWEMNEIGSVTRIGAMGNVNFVPDGIVLERPGTIGNAAVFSDSALIIDLGSRPSDQELRTRSSFSLCMEVVLDNKDADQHIISRARSDWTSINPHYEDWSFSYDAIYDKFKFQVLQYKTAYEVLSNDLGSPVIGQKYHIYIEYNKLSDQIIMRVDFGLKDIIQLPLAFDINLFTGATLAITLGRFSTQSANRYMYGSIDQLYWFWETLTEDEQEWVYNNGNSRAFSEL